MPVKHVVTLAPFRQTILVTGFGAFPGAPTNPSAMLLDRLQRHRTRLARLGIDLHCVLLPVVYAELGPRLDAAVAACHPDAILHLGLASRRPHISVETRALNRAGTLHPDAAKRLPARQLVVGGAGTLKATYPAATIHAALRRAGHNAKLSNDAGDYVCNATLYLSLQAKAAAHIGFVHVPRLQRRTQPCARTRRRRPSLDALSQAALTAILLMRRRLPPSS